MKKSEFIFTMLIVIGMILISIFFGFGLEIIFAPIAALFQ